MDPQSFERAEEIFHAAVSLPPVERRRYLDDACGADEQLRKDVESLLAVADNPPSFLDRAAISPAVFEQLADDSAEEGDIALPARVGAYRLLREIGRGGMGAVYEAEQDGIQRRVAIKLIRSSMASAPLVRRFRVEQRILAGLEHPNIARLYDASTTDAGLPYLVMEHVEGANLIAYCADRRLGLDARLRLFERVCAAVQYAHQHLVVHRDLKPSNILITDEGEPKLLDFGIAKLLNADTEALAAGATVTGLRLMTPEYASPEQIRGEPITTASDLYSLGVVLYELITGRRVYRLTSRSAHEIEHAVLVQEPARPSTAVLRASGEPVEREWTFPVVPRRHAAALRGDLDNIVLRSLAKDPAKRYATAEELADDLRRFRAGLPVRARPDSLRYRTGKFVARHRWAVTAGAAVAIALVAALIVAMTSAAEARRERDLAARRFADVRQLANVFLFDVEQKIRDIAGTTAARELLVTTGLSYLDRLTADAGDDVSLMRELANGYDRLGDVQGGLLQSNLGRSEAALASYGKASVLRRRLVDVHGTREPEFLRESARGEQKLSQALLRVGRLPDAVEHSGRAVQLLASAGATGDVVDTTRQRAEALINHGFLLATVGDADASVKTLREAVALYEGLPPERLRESSIGRGYAFALFRLAQILGEFGDAAEKAEAVEIAERMVVIDRALLDAEPHRADLRRGLSRDLAKLGDLLADNARHEQAIVQYAEVIQLTDQDIALDSNDRLARRNRATVSARLAQSLLALDRAEQARTLLEPSLAETATLLAEDAQNITLQVTFAEVTVSLAQAGLRLSTSRADQELRRFVDRIEPPLVRTVAILEGLVAAKTLTGSDAAVLDAAKAALAEVRQLTDR